MAVDSSGVASWDVAQGTPPSRLFYWRETTDAQPFETGIQRVTRRLADGLARRGIAPLAAGWDPVRRLMRGVEAAGSFDAGRAWLLVPEIPTTILGKGPDPIRLARAYGLRSAVIVHDLIPVRFAPLYPPATVELFRHYYRMVAGADLVLATTELVAGHLREYLAGEGLSVPGIVVVPLPAQFGALPRSTAAPAPRRSGDPLRILTVSTFEARKNLARLLRAVRRARECGGPSIALTLVGRRGLDCSVDGEIDGLLAGLPDCEARARTDDAELAALYAMSHASVYPSCEEGFGLPVLESLLLGRPCACHAGSAMAEVAPGGGALMLDMGDDTAITDALIRLANEAGLLERLTADATARPLRSWNDYAADVAASLVR